MRFKEPPGSFDLIGQGHDLLREHGDQLEHVAATLKTVTAAVGAGLQSMTDEGKDALATLAVDAVVTLQRVGETVSDAAGQAWQWTKEHADVIAQVGDVLSSVGTALGVVALATCWIPGVNGVTAGLAMGVSAAALGVHALAKAAGANVPWSKMGMDALGSIPAGRYVAGAKQALTQAGRVGSVMKTSEAAGAAVSAVANKGGAATQKMVGKIGEVVTFTGPSAKGIAPTSMADLKSNPVSAIHNAAQFSHAKSADLAKFVLVRVDPFSKAGIAVGSTLGSAKAIGIHEATEHAAGLAGSEIHEKIRRTP